jgi:hypothetical protein
VFFGNAGYVCGIFCGAAFEATGDYKQAFLIGEKKRSRRPIERAKDDLNVATPIPTTKKLSYLCRFEKSYL